MPAAAPPRTIESSAFAIICNGYADGPAQALRDWLVARGARSVLAVSHPLVAGDRGRHELREWRRGELVRERGVVLPSRPPVTYPLDLLVPAWPRPVDVWFGFNALACWRGLTARRLGRAGQVAYWCVDYVDNRFGTNPLTRAFEVIDGICCRRADVRIELSAAALEARSARHAGGRPLAPAHVVPMGAWLDRVPVSDPLAVARRRVVYMGHLVPRQGVATLVEALALLRARGADVTADIVGDGPQAGELRQRARAAGLDGVVTFHGFVERHTDVERILANASVAAAPYATQGDSFTRFADPGKLKAYLAAGLPVVLTDVPPNARALADAGAVELCDGTPEAVAAGIERLLCSPERWASAREAALAVAREYDWPAVLAGALAALGYAG